MGPMSLEGLPEHALLLVDSAPIIYVLEEHAELAPIFRPIFEAHQNGLVRLAVTTVTRAEVLTGPLRNGDEVLAERYRSTLKSWFIGADALVTHDRDFSPVR